MSVNDFTLVEKFGYTPFFQDDYTVELVKINNVKKLIQFIKNNRNCPPVVLDYVDFLIYQPLGTTVEESFVFDDKKTGSSRKLNLKIEVNKGKTPVGFSGNSVFNVEFNEENRPLFKIIFTYEGAMGTRNSETSAVVITSSLYDDIEAVREYLLINEAPGAKEIIIKEFRKAFRRVGSVKMLNDLYKFTPSFVLQDRGDEQLWKDMQLLLNFDEASIFDDSSAALVRLLAGFNNTEMLYDKLYESSAQVIRLYDLINGKHVEPFLAFLGILAAFHGNENESNLLKVYKGKNYSLFIDTKLGNIPGISIKNYYARDQPEEFWKAGDIEQFNVDLGDLQLNTGFLNPMTMVMFENKETGENALVPVLYLKYMDDKEFWEALIDLVGLTLTVISILGSLGIIATGVKGVLLWLAVGDLVLSNADLLMQSDDIKNALQQTEGGRWLVENWNNISLIGGGVLLSTVLVKGILQAAPDIIATLVKKSGSRELLDLYMRMYAAVVIRMEIRSSVEGTLRMISISELRSFSTGPTWQNLVCKGMEETGLTLVVGKEARVVRNATSSGFLGQTGTQTAVIGNDQYSIIWKGEVIHSGDFSSAQSRLKYIFERVAEDVVKWADNFIDTVGLVKYGDSKLSNLAMEYRRALGMRADHKGNIAIFQYTDESGKSHTRIFSTIEEKLFATDKRHAERIGKEALEAEGIPLDGVTHIFSEYAPCELGGAECKDLLETFFPKAKVSYSYEYPGTDSDPIGIKARQLSREKRAKDFIKLFK